MPILTISIVNWNSYKLIRKCIESIFCTVKDVSCEVFIVDNNSSIEDKEQVKNLVHIFPGVNIILNKNNIGYASAHNQVIRSTSSPYILLLNPDSTLCPNTIDCMIYTMESEKDIGIAAAKVVSPKGGTYTTVRPFPTIKNEFFSMVQNYFYPFGAMFTPSAKKNICEKSKPNGKIQNVVKVQESIAGPFLLLRRTMIDDIGLLEEDFFLFSEENDLCLRADKRGWQRAYFPQYKILHSLGGARRNAPPGFSQYHQARSKLLFFEKHHGKISMYSLATIYSFFATYSLLISWVKKPLVFCFNRKQNVDHIRYCRSILKAVCSVIAGKTFHFPGTK